MKDEHDYITRLSSDLHEILYSHLKIMDNEGLDQSIYKSIALTSIISLAADFIFNFVTKGNYDASIKHFEKLLISMVESFSSMHDEESLKNKKGPSK
jgi:hypothetical protein